MTNVSYAQNYEDVMLLRVLGGVKRGFYIDVGAQDPVNDSVTKMFYEQGWHGINIEPVSHWYERLLVDRPHDINLQLAVSDAPGQLHLFEVVDSGLSTTDPLFAQRHAEAGFRIRESDVSCVTLDHICEMHGVTDVHFLKIDCEGAEAAALRGISLKRIRPWIILAEATEPNSQRPAYTEWEPLLIQRGYQFAYADGLNRFYVADEHAELLGAFAYPPNVFDKFVRAPEAAAHEHLREAQGRLAVAIDAQQMARLHAENERRETALVELRRVLDERDCELTQSHDALTQVNDELAQAKDELAQANDELAQAKDELAQAKDELAQAKDELAQAKDELVQGNERMRHSADELLRLHEESNLRIPEIDRLRHEIAVSDREVGRLHYAVEARNQEIGRLNETLQAAHESTSWRITAPLRAVGRATHVLRRVGRGSVYQTVRWPARVVRPILRKVVQWSWLRSPVVAIAGHDSRVVAKARLFLFGAPPSVPAQGAILPEVPLTRTAMTVLELINQVRKQK